MGCCAWWGAQEHPGSSAYLEENFVGVENLYLAFYIKLSAWPAADARIAMVSNAGTTIGNLVLRTNGKLRLRNGSTQVGLDSTFALQPNTLYRIGLHQKKGTGGNAVLEAFVVEGDTLFGLPFASLANGSWSSKADRVRLGATNGNAVDLWLDDISLDNAVMPLPTPPQAVRVLRYSYDGLQRLTGAAESSGVTFAWGYDLAGNRTQVQLNGVTTESRMYNAANQVTNAGYSYDNAGNLLNDGTTSYSYNALNRMIARGSTTYSYNGDGTLVSQAMGGVTTRYTQDLAAPLSQVLQTKAGTAPISEYLYGHNRLASLASGTKTWYVGDALGSVRRTVADNGTPLGIVNYDPWGTPESGTVPTFGFTGELQDVGAGLVNLRARWYSTNQGKFTSVDPFVGFPEQPYSLHPYQYGYSDPILNIDPTGEHPDPLRRQITPQEEAVIRAIIQMDYARSYLGHEVYFDFRRDDGFSGNISTVDIINFTLHEFYSVAPSGAYGITDQIVRTANFLARLDLNRQYPPEWSPSGQNYKYPIPIPDIPNYLHGRRQERATRSLIPRIQKIISLWPIIPGSGYNPDTDGVWAIAAWQDPSSPSLILYEGVDVNRRRGKLARQPVLAYDPAQIRDFLKDCPPLEPPPEGYQLPLPMPPGPGSSPYDPTKRHRPLVPSGVF